MGEGAANVRRSIRIKHDTSWHGSNCLDKKTINPCSFAWRPFRNSRIRWAAAEDECVGASRIAPWPAAKIIKVRYELTGSTVRTSPLMIKWQMVPVLRSREKFLASSRADAAPHSTWSQGRINCAVGCRVVSALIMDCCVSRIDRDRRIIVALSAA